MPSADHEFLREIATDEHRPPEERAFLQLIQSETGVPLFSPEKVIGTITAVSFRPSTLHVRREGSSWSSKQHGIHPLHTSLLEFHARWLGPALETIQQIVRREPQLSALSTAARQLTDIISRGRPAELLTFASLVVATHNNGLRFHQAMVAETVDERDDAAGVHLKGKGDLAWGCMTFDEQVHSHIVRDSLENDLTNALLNVGKRPASSRSRNREGKDYCEEIRSNWSVLRLRTG